MSNKALPKTAPTRTTQERWRLLSSRWALDRFDALAQHLGAQISCADIPAHPPPCRRLAAAARLSLPQDDKARIAAAFDSMAEGYSEWVVDRQLVPGMFQAFVTELEPELRGRAGAQVRTAVGGG